MKKVKRDILVGMPNSKGKPYIAEIEIEGTNRLLFDRVNAEEKIKVFCDNCKKELLAENL